jgi:hypothetical protein
MVGIFGLSASAARGKAGRQKPERKRNIPAGDGGIGVFEFH